MQRVTGGEEEVGALEPAGGKAVGGLGGGGYSRSYSLGTRVTSKIGREAYMGQANAHQPTSGICPCSIHNRNNAASASARLRRRARRACLPALSDEETKQERSSDPSTAISHTLMTVSAPQQRSKTLFLLPCDASQCTVLGSLADNTVPMCTSCHCTCTCCCTCCGPQREPVRQRHVSSAADQ